jgi:hypothetical protein
MDASCLLGRYCKIENDQYVPLGSERMRIEVLLHLCVGVNIFCTLAPFLQT